MSEVASAALPDDRRATAIHEAGHAVMSIHERRPFRSVSIVADEHTEGRVLGMPIGDWFQPDRWVDLRTRRLIEREIAVLLAGPLAEDRYHDSNNPDPLDLLTAATGAEHDYSTVVDLASYVCGSPAETEAFVEWLTQRTLNTIRGEWWWAPIERLADELVSVGALGYRRARTLVLEHQRETFRRRLLEARKE